MESERYLTIRHDGKTLTLFMFAVFESARVGVTWTMAAEHLNGFGLTQTMHHLEHCFDVHFRSV